MKGQPQQQVTPDQPQSLQNFRNILGEQTTPISVVYGILAQHSDGAMPVLAGIVVGLVGAIGLARFIQSMLFAMKPIDAPTLLGLSVLFLRVGLLACAVLASRAAKIDPMSALRQE